MTTAHRIAVVGGGISGLTAAYRLRRRLGPGASITIFDPAQRFGGVLRTITLGEHRVDIGAEAFITRRPEIPELLDELGLADKQIGTTGLRPLVYAGGALAELPAGTVNGIPVSGISVAGLVDEATVARIDAEPARPLRWTPGTDPTVAELVSDRFGPQVVARLVDPLLGGVYAGSAASTGLRAAAPAVARALDEGAPSLLAAARKALPPTSSAGVFGAVEGGYAVLLAELERRAAVSHRAVAVTGLVRDGAGFRVIGDETSEPVDAVVVAVPAPRAAAVLREVAPESARAAGAIGVASSVVVAVVLPGSAPVPPHSGVLVASGEPLHAKAITFSTRKWGQRGSETQLVRMSFGRYGDSIATTVTADQLSRWVAEDLHTILGEPVAPLHAEIARWPDAMPQYGPGHAGIVREVRAGLPAGVAVAGSYLDGIGVPACVAAATAAAETVVARWGHA